MFSVLSNGYSQKSSLSLLPSGAKEINSYESETEQHYNTKKVTAMSFSKEELLITPKQKNNRKYSEPEKYKFCNIIGSIYKKKWSLGLMRIFKLPTTSGITIY